MGSLPPSSSKRSYDPYKWPYRWVIGVISPMISGVTVFHPTDNWFVGHHLQIHGNAWDDFDHCYCATHGRLLKHVEITFFCDAKFGCLHRSI